MSYQITSIDLVGTTIEHVFYIKVKRKEYRWILLTEMDDCEMPTYRIQWRNGEPDDIDEDELINDLLDTL